MMRTTIMTEKLVRRGVRVAGEYDVDPLAHVIADELATKNPRTIDADLTVGDTLSQLDRHQAYPVVRHGKLCGVVTTRELMAAHRAEVVGTLVARAPVVARPSQTARAVVELMARSDVGRIILVAENDPTKTIGIITRSDVVAAFAKKSAPKGAPEGI